MVDQFSNLTLSKYEKKSIPLVATVNESVILGNHRMEGKVVSGSDKERRRKTDMVDAVKLARYKGIEIPKHFGNARWSRNFISWIEGEAKKDIVLEGTLLLMLEEVNCYVSYY
jgi:hypothetical protein